VLTREYTPGITATVSPPVAAAHAISQDVNDALDLQTALAANASEYVFTVLERTQVVVPSELDGGTTNKLALAGLPPP
jgi:hypothetical protein